MSERINNLSKLAWLDLSNNRLNDLPDNIISLTNLWYIDLDGNPLIDLSILKYLSSLKMLDFLAFIFLVDIGLS